MSGLDALQGPFQLKQPCDTVKSPFPPAPFPVPQLLGLPPPAPFCLTSMGRKAECATSPGNEKNR